MHNSTIIKSLFLKSEPSFLGLSEILHALVQVRSQAALDRLAWGLVGIADRARFSRDTALCNDASSLLKGLPVSRSLRWIAEYYSATQHFSSAADPDDTRKRLLGGIADTDARYLPSILLKLGNTYDCEGDQKEALRYYVEAERAAAETDRLVTTHAAENVTLLRSDDGDHCGALQCLERLWPVVLGVSCDYPHLYFGHLNNLALVLIRTGDIERSRRAIAGALACPFADRFPEWRETEREIEELARQESRRRPATLPVVSIPAPKPRPRKSAIRAPRNSPAVLLITFLRQPRATDDVTPRERNILSPILERYIRTVRIRDQT